MQMEMPHRPKGVPGSTELDILAKKGLLKSNDTPGEDTYDDGMDEHGRLTQGSTVTESGGTYREDIGPHDMVQRDESENLRATSDMLSIVEDPEAEADAAEVQTDIYAGEDAAAKWLQENDPLFRKKGDK